MAPVSAVPHSVAVSHPPTAPGFAAWENANGAARPHSADGMFGPGDGSAGSSTDTSAPPGHGPGAQHYSTPGRPPLLSNYSSGSGRMFAYMPNSSSDEFASPGYASFDSSYSPYQAPDTASTSQVVGAPNGSNGNHRGSAASTNTASSSTEGSANGGVTITPAATKKRPRRRYDEIERMYPCNWPGCTKSYGTLNHLNAHVAMQKHGNKRLPHEFKEMRKLWRKSKRDEEQRRQSTSRIPSGTAAASGGGQAPGGPLPPGVPLPNGVGPHPPGSAGGMSSTEDPYFRGTRMDSFSSAPGGYAGEAGGAGYYPGHAAPGGYHPPPAGSYAGPRGSTSSVYSYATAPPGSSSAPNGVQGPPGGGHWIQPYGANNGSNGAPNSGPGHMFPPPPGPPRSYSMSAAGVAASAPHNAAAANGGAWSNQPQHAYSTAPPPPYGGAGAGYQQGPHGYHGYSGGYAGGYANGNGGMSAPSTSAGGPGANGAGAGANHSAHGMPATSVAPPNNATATQNLGAYLMAHRGSI